MLSELIRVFGRIGLLSFGGPAAQIALMHKELVEDRDWLSEQDYLKALSFCMLLPGPEAMQLATYAGWKRAGILGGFIGGGLFVLPGAVVIAALALLYGRYGDLAIVQSLFLGVKACVVVIVLQALIKISGRALVSRLHKWIAITTFIALFAFQLPFPVVIVIAAILGATHPAPNAPVSTASRPMLGTSIKTVLIGICVWLAPLVILAVTNQHLLFEIGKFFSVLAVVTFGGAYAVLSYMTQEVVVSYQWLSTQQMMDALGLAETTPGPLILVTQFVGMLVGWMDNGIAGAIWAGLLTLWVTFVPCFIWIFAGAPLIDWLDSQPRLRSGLNAITAAVVGVIANLSLWFGLHVIFEDVTIQSWSIISIPTPEISSVSWVALVLTILSYFWLVHQRWSLPATLGTCALIGVVMGSF
uniref:chromate efflux transporter n=1 Tax=Loktanella sp. S4079 TaxID=579483 RepID=UPI000B28FFA5